MVTVGASLLSPKGKAHTAISNARRYATRYLDIGYEADRSLREKPYAATCEQEQVLRELPKQYRDEIKEGEQGLLELLRRTHEVHEDRFECEAAGHRLHHAHPVHPCTSRCSLEIRLGRRLDRAWLDQVGRITLSASTPLPTVVRHPWAACASSGTTTSRGPQVGG